MFLNSSKAFSVSLSTLLRYNSKKKLNFMIHKIKTPNFFPDKFVSKSGVRYKFIVSRVIVYTKKSTEHWE